MKMKNGFTLAEVLITLAIIGVVASLTLPALMANTQEQQSMTAYRKVLNSLNEAGQISAAINGFDYSTMTGAGTIDDSFSDGATMTLGSIIHDQLKVSPNANDVTLGNQSNCAVLTDGTAICLGSYTVVGESDAKSIVVDTNGTKGPNQLATCNEEGCTTKSSRKIYDQFYVTLYGGNAYPGLWSAVETLDADSNENFAATYAAGIANIQ